ncbi:MAG: NUDIX hydrolase [Bacteroidetes bacterium]|nr:MAG: NUDIX hydrolase [Bacteroidota bacterium]REK07622.1 MAG: NUDIX hydrolase [Bacteroidota bacterium]REK36946.1 MAG: NUDIX hydrolase [Bacteroidota bacterium]REK47766.1 MAG: NUDIX hydrolase [Bacteroidota bacterium]
MSSEYFAIVRVYGIFINDSNEILLSDEFLFDRAMVKFPGGGLRYGEGIKECLYRELLEETGQQFEILDHIYTSDFFISSAFHADKQVISVYYFVKPQSEIDFRVSNTKFDFQIKENGAQSFRFVRFSDLKEEEMTYPADKFIVGMLKEKLQLGAIL